MGGMMSAKQSQELTKGKQDYILFVNTTEKNVHIENLLIKEAERKVVAQ